MELDASRITWDIISDMWHPERNPSGYLSVGMAENTLLHDTSLEYINSSTKLSTEHLTYSNESKGSNVLRKAVSHFLNRHFNPFRPVEPGHVLMTNGCYSAIEHLSWSFLNPGDAILLSKPYYSTFSADLTLRPESLMIPVEMSGADLLGPEAVERYEQAATEFEEHTGKRVRGSMLCNPHNSLGRCYPRATVDRMIRFCQSRRMHLISHEIYALSGWNNRVDTDVPFTPFESLLSRDTTGLIDPALVHVLWGMSKNFGANGLRVDTVISQSNPKLHMSQRCLSLYSFVSSMSDQITAPILQNYVFTDNYIQENRELLSQSHEFLVRLLKKHNIEHRHGCNAGFFVWVNLGKKYLEAQPEEVGEGFDLADAHFKKLLDNKMPVAHGTAYGSENPGSFRLIFLYPGLRRQSHVYSVLYNGWNVESAAIAFMTFVCGHF